MQLQSIQNIILEDEQCEYGEDIIFKDEQSKYDNFLLTLINNPLQGISLKNITLIELLDTRRTGLEISSLGFSILTTNCPNLTSLCLEFALSRTTKTTHPLLPFKNLSRCQKLSSFSIINYNPTAIGVADSLLEGITSIPKLTQLSLRFLSSASFNENFYMTLLQACGSTLELLELSLPDTLPKPGTIIRSLGRTCANLTCLSLEISNPTQEAVTDNDWNEFFTSPIPGLEKLVLGIPLPYRKFVEKFPALPKLKYLGIERGCVEDITALFLVKNCRISHLVIMDASEWRGSTILNIIEQQNLEELYLGNLSKEAAEHKLLRTLIEYESGDAMWKRK